MPDQVRHDGVWLIRRRVDNTRVKKSGNKHPYNVIPEKSIKAMAMSPVTIILMPKPSSPLGTSAYRSFCRIAAMETMASILLNH